MPVNARRVVVRNHGEIPCEPEQILDTEAFTERKGGINAYDVHKLVVWFWEDGDA